MKSTLNSAWFFTLLFVLSSCDRTPSPPAVTAMNPASGYYMTEVTVTGTGFSNQSGSNGVTVNDVDCEIVSSTTTSVTFRIPALTEGEWPVRLITETGEAEAGMFSYQYTVYAAGCENNSTGRSIGKYWKNGIEVSLTDGTANTILSAVAVSSADVWTAGNLYTLQFTGSCWKNSRPYALTTTTESGAYDILCSGNDTYVAGYESNGTKDVAKYWKNGTSVSLTDGTTDACAYSLTVSGTDLYVAGLRIQGTKPVATYWKNGNPVYLTDGTFSARASDICVSGGDVYVSGYENSVSNFTVAKYWKNGSEVILSDGTSRAWAYSVAVKGSEVHVVGNNGQGACYWKNGIPVAMDCNPSVTTFTAVFLIGNDIYVAGSERQGDLERACYWKNGTRVWLTDGTKLATTNSIFVI